MKKASQSNIEQFVIDRVRDSRFKLKISQTSLAQLLDVSDGFIGNVESPNHRAKYNLNHLNELVRIFESTSMDILSKGYL